MAGGIDPVCKFYTPEQPDVRRLAKPNRFRTSRKFVTTRFSLRACLTDPFDALCRLFTGFPTSSATLRAQRSLRHLMRRASYLHILILPALLLMFVEMPGTEVYTDRLRSPSFSHQSASPVEPPLSVDRLALSKLPVDARQTVDAPQQPSVVTPSSAVRNGTSIVACCMNRHGALRKGLAAWRLVDSVDEIIVVDWSSSPPLRDVVTQVADADPRVRLIRVEGEQQWILSRAYNLAMAASSYSHVVRTDCDYELDKDFLSVHQLDVPADSDQPLRRFYAGNYQHARNENEVHLNGAVYIKRSDFLGIGGYDERIQTYGWDDEDLYTRLQDAGLKKMNISYDHVSHVPHGDGDRAQKDVKFVQVEIDLNSLLLKHLPKWSQTSLDDKEWSVKNADATNAYSVVSAAKKPAALKDLVDPANVTAAWNMALGQRLANDYQVPWDIMETMDVRSKRNLLTRLNLRMNHREPSQPARILFAHVMHGLGNRLRALGSAMSFANETDRELVLIWETDAHIAANFSDLFRDDMVVITNFKPKWPFKDYDKWDKAWLSFEFFNYMEMEGDGAVKGQIIKDIPEKHLYFKSAYIIEASDELTNWEKDNAMLRSLEPVEEVKTMVKGHKGLSNMVGIHIRDRTLDRDIKNVNFDAEYGDEASKTMEYWRKKSSYKTFMAEMQRRLKEDESLEFYIATDTVGVIDKLRAEFHDKVHSTDRDCDTRDGYCVKFALVDILCLAQSRELIGSNWSSFTEAASRIGGKAAKLAGQDFAVDAERPE